MAELTNINIYLDNKAYPFDVVVDTQGAATRYQVRQDRSTGNHVSFLPDEFVLNEGGQADARSGIHTVEQLQVVRLIWQEIRDTLNVPS